MSTSDEATALAARWCAIPSVPGDLEAQSRQAAEIIGWLRDKLSAAILSPAGTPPWSEPPVIHARVDVDAPTTLILYNMYDVVSADPTGWQCDPFTGGTAEMDGVGRVFVARGAENNKGPLAAMLVALESLKAEGRLAVNVEILIEGQEESGSGALRAYLEDAACPVRYSEAGLFPSFCEYGGGPPRLYLGFSGIAKGVILAESGAWGGPRRAAHSSNAPWIANPARVLVDALARLGSPATGTLDHIEPDAPARAQIRQLAEEFDPQGELRFRDTARFVLDGDAEALLTHVLTRASVNISALQTDPPWADAVIPRAAHARLDIRCPPGLDTANVAHDCAARLEDISGVSLEIDDSYPGVRFDAETRGVAALMQAYAAASTAPQIWPWAIGSAPGYAFAPHARSFLIGGAGRSGNAHSVDEYFTLEGMERLVASVRHWLMRMAS